MHFGFSYVGLVFLIMLFLPNFFWTKHKPQGYEQEAKKESKILLAFERTGEVLVTALCLIFSDFNLSLTPWAWWLAASFFFMILYEIWWIRYFTSEKRLTDFYRSLLKIPVPGATLPVVAFFLLAIYGKNPFLFIATIILGIGHIGIHLMHRSNLKRK